MRCRTDAGCRDAGGTAANTALILHPELVRLRAACEMLRAELVQLVFEHAQLRCVIGPNLEAEYLLKVGRCEYELLCTQLEVRRLRRTVSLLQAAINRNEVISVPEVEARLAVEYADWEAQVQEMAAQLQAAGAHRANLMSEKESAELHRLYRSLARRLHPDVNPAAGAQERRLWQWAKDAYAAGNLADLRLLDAIVGPGTGEVLTPADGESILAGWQQRYDELAAHVAAEWARLAALQSQFPFYLRPLLDDPVWVAEQRTRLQAELKEALGLRERYQQMVASLWAMLPATDRQAQPFVYTWE